MPMISKQPAPRFWRFTVYDPDGEAWPGISDVQILQENFWGTPDEPQVRDFLERELDDYRNLCVHRHGYEVGMVIKAIARCSNPELPPVEVSVTLSEDDVYP